MKSAPTLCDELDRLCEFANVGAGHAAGALAQLLGIPLRMRPPAIRTGEIDASRGEAGVLFRVQGGPGGWLAVFFAPASRGALLAALLGSAPVDPDTCESALAEVGNILVSHALSAVSELAGTRVLPRPPVVALRNPGARFAGLLGRTAGRSAVRIETELIDGGGRCRGRLLWVPAGI